MAGPCGDPSLRTFERGYLEIGSHALIDAFSDICLKSVWGVEHFACWMTALLHTDPSQDAFALRLQISV